MNGGGCAARYVQFDKNVAHMPVNRTRTNSKRLSSKTAIETFFDEALGLDDEATGPDLCFIDRVRNVSWPS